MKREISPGVIVAILVVVVVAIAAIGWKTFGPRHESKADKDSYLASHPEAKAAQDNMHQMGQKLGSGQPIQPPNNVRTR
jgi:hypothetical protein